MPARDFPERPPPREEEKRVGQSGNRRRRPLEHLLIAALEEQPSRDPKPCRDCRYGRQVDQLRAPAGAYACRLRRHEHWSLAARAARPREGDRSPEADDEERREDSRPEQPGERPEMIVLERELARSEVERELARRRRPEPDERVALEIVEPGSAVGVIRRSLRPRVERGMEVEARA